MTDTIFYTGEIPSERVNYGVLERILKKPHRDSNRGWRLEVTRVIHYTMGASSYSKGNMTNISVKCRKGDSPLENKTDKIRCGSTTLIVMPPNSVSLTVNPNSLVYCTMVSEG